MRNALVYGRKDNLLGVYLTQCPLRIATTGIMHGPDLASSICLLGKEKVLSRLEQF